MKIGIDARLIEETGVGRYIRNLITELGSLDAKNDYVIFLPKKAFSSFNVPNSRWKKVLADVHWHTLREQLVMPRLFASEHLDLVHIPYHNPPIFYSGRMVVTIHDLTILHFSTGKATTLPLPLYQLKRFGYWLELWIGLRKATKIIAVSHTTKREIMDHFHISESRIAVTNEGVDHNFLTTPYEKIPYIKEPYILYVGNAYPHKNVETLISAFQRFILHRSKTSTPKLVLVGAEDFFYRRLKQFVHLLGLDSSVVFFGGATDKELANLYAHARVFVFPSYMEGFGLPALEALSFGCPVIASDIEIFHEILGEAATYFDPKNPETLTTLLPAFFTDSLKPRLKIAQVLSKYSWPDMARETLSLYESCTRL